MRTMVQKERAPAGWHTDEAQTQKTIDRSIACHVDFDNQDHENGICLDELLAEFVALNHTRYYPDLHATTDTQEPTAHPLWRRFRAEAMRHVALVLLHSNHVPGFAYDAILPAAETWCLEVGR